MFNFIRDNCFRGSYVALTWLLRDGLLRDGLLREGVTASFKEGEIEKKCNVYSWSSEFLHSPSISIPLWTTFSSLKTQSRVDMEIQVQSKGQKRNNMDAKFISVFAFTFSSNMRMVSVTFKGWGLVQCHRLWDILVFTFF